MDGGNRRIARVQNREIAFHPAWFVRGAHAQTVWGRLARSRRLVPLRREIVETPDGDDLVLDHADAEPDRGVRALLLHGLEGSSYSVYVQGMLALLAARGIPATVLNFRACARDPQRLLRWLPNRGRRLYHSGETTDFDFVFRLLSLRHPEARWIAFGTSLGGNVLLKWLGEKGSDSPLLAAATLSVPYDLAAGARHLETPLGRFYVSRFVKTLAAKAAHILATHPDLRDRVDLAAVRRATTFYEFDQAATAPLHGFAGAGDYWEKSSSIRLLSRIETPTLCFSALDDPFLPRNAVFSARESASSSVEFIVTESGGHAGWVEGGVPWDCSYWAERLAVDTMLQAAGAGR